MFLLTLILIVIDAAAAQAAEEEQNTNDAECSLNNMEGHVAYTYEQLIERIQTQLKDRNPNMISKVKGVKGEEPNIVKFGSTKTAWQNFDSMRQKINRKPDHMLQFFTAELGVEGNFGNEGHMIFQGRFQSKHITPLYKHYLSDYVRCLNCKSLNTTLDKDQSTRLFMMECQDCGAKRSVNAIKSGFQAVKRGERRKAR